MYIYFNTLFRSTLSRKYAPVSCGQITLISCQLHPVVGTYLYSFISHILTLLRNVSIRRWLLRVQTGTLFVSYIGNQSTASPAQLEVIVTSVGPLGLQAVGGAETELDALSARVFSIHFCKRQTERRTPLPNKF